MTDAQRLEPDMGARHAAFCKALIRHRRATIEVLGKTLCPAPTLDMLLALYLARYEGRKMYLLGLCAASEVPTATAHRKISNLVKEELVERYDNPADRRQVELRLSAKGQNAIDQILGASIT